MKFRCSENHVCASHKTPVVFYSITNRVRTVGDRVSLIIPFVVETQNTDFLQDFSPVIITLQKSVKKFTTL